eukprot:gene2394-2481_t
MPGQAAQALYDGAWLACEVVDTSMAGSVQVRWDEDGSLSEMPVGEVRRVNNSADYDYDDDDEDD